MATKGGVYDLNICLSQKCSYQELALVLCASWVCRNDRDIIRS